MNFSLRLCAFYLQGEIDFQTCPSLCRQQCIHLKPGPSVFAADQMRPLMPVQTRDHRQTTFLMKSKTTTCHQLTQNDRKPGNWASGPWNSYTTGRYTASYRHKYKATTKALTASTQSNNSLALRTNIYTSLTPHIRILLKVCPPTQLTPTRARLWVTNVNMSFPLRVEC